MKKGKVVKKEVRYVIELPDGTTMIPGPGNVRTSHKGVPAKDFLKALDKASKEASEAGVFDSDEEIYGNKSTASAR